MYALGRAREKGEWKLYLFDREVQGWTSAEYGEKVEPVDNYGAGYEPVSYSKGKKTCEGSVTMDIKEVHGILAAMFPGIGKSLNKIPPFPIIFASGDGIENVEVADVLESCRFTEHKYTISDGASTVMVTIPIKIGKIIWGSSAL